MYFTAHRARAYVGRGSFRHHGFNVAAVTSEPVFAAVTKIANVVDVAAGGDDLN